MKSPSSVIVVDDDDVTRLSISALLTELGYRVREFRDGESAWESYDETPSRFILADWKLPGLDGLELCRRVRNRHATPYTYFVLITAARAGEIGYDYAIGADVDDFLLKPVEFSALWRRMRVAERILRFTTQMQQMGALLPICSCCHKIRDEKSSARESLEEYIQKHTGSQFSHGYCTECEKEMTPKFGRAVGASL